MYIYIYVCRCAELKRGYSVRSHLLDTGYDFCVIGIYIYTYMYIYIYVQLSLSLSLLLRGSFGFSGEASG